MMRLFFAFYFLAHVSFAQITTVHQCKYRFDNYLNFKGSLNHRVEFQKEVIYIKNATGKKILAIYAAEIPMLAKFFTNTSFSKQEKLLKFKGLKILKAPQRDSILAKVNDKRANLYKLKGLPLSGYRVAIDPGHSATTLSEAEIEQKFLYFVKDSINHPNDSIKLFESVLTFNTAQLLQKMLEEQGAKVMITRSQNNFSSFNCTYTTWLNNNKIRVLDSLKDANALPKVKYNKLLKMNDHDVFWEFFRDFELNNRAKVMNEFNPHASVIIHYNVDEKNEPWKQTSKKNFTMAFIGGAFTSDNLDKPENLVHFVRLLVTDELNQSEILSHLTVTNFTNNLDVPIAAQFDASYLKDNCLLTKSPGVFSRNLNLCRLVNSPLVYGESLYQDNEKECEALMKLDTNFKGIKTNDRVLNVSKSYYQAVLMFLKN